ncbi:hypothetical protein AVEN_145101-1 [Araneus ventricosus]|uniref:Uncharacterized protein n=1 Tax=Araneus ventricosus TaxID=182803 RepID=A0A4Y1ZLU2_ARAVE|nr:hypothetical protein AVEN_145101-1 [Araneus ventricosus]
MSIAADFAQKRYSVPMARGLVGWLQHSRETSDRRVKGSGQRTQYISYGQFRLGRGGLLARSRIRCWRAPGSKPDSTEDPPCKGHAKAYAVAKRPPAGAARKPGNAGASLGAVVVI